VKVRMEKNGGALQLTFNYGDYHGSYFMVGLMDFDDDYREEYPEKSETDKTETVKEPVVEEIIDEHGVHEVITTPWGKPDLTEDLLENPSSRIPHSVETEEVLV